MVHAMSLTMSWSVLRVRGGEMRVRVWMVEHGDALLEPCPMGVEEKRERSGVDGVDEDVECDRCYCYPLPVCSEFYRPKLL